MTIGETAPVIETSALVKMYGNLAAVDHVDLVVPQGSIFGLIGPNGAGKSTLMSMIASLLLPSGGALRVMGYDPITQARSVRENVGYMPDGLGVYEGMNVQEYLDFFLAAYEVPYSQWATLSGALLELVELSVKTNAPVNSLSRGMKQRLSLARALVHDPGLLILDEPASGLDPRARVELRDLMLRLQSMGKTLIVSSHILSELQEVCSHVGIMEAGRLLASGAPEEILDHVRPTRQVRVRFADGSTETHGVVDEVDQARLLRQLVLEDERGVIEFVEETVGLEDVFLTVTEGIVQ